MRMWLWRRHQLLLHQLRSISKNTERRSRCDRWCWEWLRCRDRRDRRDCTSFRCCGLCLCLLPGRLSLSWRRRYCAFFRFWCLPLKCLRGIKQVIHHIYAIIVGTSLQIISRQSLPPVTLFQFESGIYSHLALKLQPITRCSDNIPGP